MNNREAFEAAVTDIGILASFEKNDDESYCQSFMQYLEAVWDRAIASQAQQPALKDQREAFQVWMRSDVSPLNKEVPFDHEIAEVAWESWQASQASKAIAVPVSAVKVCLQGVRFGEYCFYSHERITGFDAEQLNSGLCSLAARKYIEWVRAALPPAPEGGKT